MNPEHLHFRDMLDILEIDPQSANQRLSSHPMWETPKVETTMFSKQRGS